MNNTDFIVENRLRNQLLSVYSHFYHNPEERRQQTLSMLFSNLDSAKTVKEFKTWCEDVGKCGYSLADCDGVEIFGNVMGLLADTAFYANDSTIAAFMSWKQGVNSDNWHQRYGRECKDVQRVRKAVKGDYDAHIVLFKCGRQWAAIDDDANRLFELFGWQTSYVDDGGDFPVSWMYVTAEGLEVLKVSPYTVKILDLGKVNVMSNAYLEDLVSCAQQFADYKRMLIKNIGKAHDKIKCDMGVIAHTLAVQKDLDIYSFRFEGDKIIAELDRGGEILMADGKNWIFNDIGLPLTLALGKSI